MTNSIAEFSLLVQLATTFFLVGTICFIQIIQYPLLEITSPAEFSFYERRYRTLTTRLMVLPMLIELVTAIILLPERPVGVEPWMVWTGLGLLFIIWFITISIQVPGHRVLSEGFDPAVYRRLTRSNWMRTGCWTLRGALLTWMTWNCLSIEGSSNSMGLQVGDMAPDFAAMTFDGRQVSLADYRGKKGVVLFFYPKDGTSVCTKEACAFRDSYQKFVDAGVEVIGVSGDSDNSHQKFSREHSLSYPLISDADGSLRKKYSVPDMLWLIPRRVTYVIDKEGKIQMIFSALLASDDHVRNALDALGIHQSP